MDLYRAQREGREEEFKKEAQEKLRAKHAAALDAEMDDYFSKRNDDEKVNGEKEPDADKGAAKDEGDNENKSEEQPVTADQQKES